MAGIRVRIHGLDELERKLGPGVVDPPIRRFLTRSALTMEAEMKRRVRVDTGHGRRSITHQVDRRRARVGTNVAYLEVMARGRKPGRRMPPPGVLLGWMRRHGIPADREFVVRRAIGRKGIRGDDFDKKALVASVPRIEAELSVLARNLEAAWRAA
jgi:hypothetical protein